MAEKKQNFSLNFAGYNSFENVGFNKLPAASFNRPLAVFR